MLTCRRGVRAVARRGLADGLAVDEAGGVWVAMGEAGGIARFAADGALDRMIEAPADFVTSLCFGGEDMRDLYVHGVAAAVCSDAAGPDVPGRPPRERAAAVCLNGRVWAQRLNKLGAWPAKD